MPTALPAPIVARQPYGLLRTAALIALLFIARLLFSAAMASPTSPMYSCGAADEIGPAGLLAGLPPL